MALAVGNCVPAMAAPTGWRESAAGWQYVNSNGSVQKGWFQDTKGDWYFLDYNTGVMKTGWIKPKDGKWYFMDYHTGAMKTGWIKPADGKWYYLNPNSNGTKGAMMTGWVQTPDKKWYYMDAASGAMQTGTITVNNQVWTLDANGVWDGKAATSITYVSSNRRPSGGSSGGGSTVDKNKVTGTGWEGNKETGEVTVTGTNVDIASIEKKLGKSITDLVIDPGKELKEEIVVTGQDGSKVGNLIIKESVGNGNVTLDSIEVTGETTIEGGGSNTVKIRNCKLNTIMAKKKINVTGTQIQPLRIKFEGNTTCAKIQASEGNLIIDVAETVTIPMIVANVAIVVQGEGTVTELKIAQTISVVLSKVTIEKLTIDKGAKPEIEVTEGTKAPAPTGDGATDAVLTGDGKVDGYYEVTLDANGGFWLVENVEDNVKEEKNIKTIKVKNGEGVGSVLGEAAGFSNPENKTGSAFMGWYIDKTITNENKVVMENSYDGKILYAGWGEEVAEAANLVLASASATATVSGGSVTPVCTVSGTAVTVTLTTTASAVSLNDMTFTAEDSSVTVSSDFQAKEVTNGMTFEVKCTPSDTNKYKVTTVTVEIIIKEK